MIKYKYQKNIDEIFTENLQNQLLTKNIGVIGCGGQGGYILEYLIRLGVKSISFWDGDNYEKSNLNRQIECTELTIGKNKAKILLNRLKNINSNIQLNCYNWYFGDNNQDYQLASNLDLIFNAADHNYNLNKLRELLRQLLLDNIPIIDCPAGLLGGYVSILTKNSLDFFDNRSIFLKNLKKENFIEAGQPAYKCALIAAEAVNQMVLYFNNSRYANIDSILNIDIYHHKYTQEDKYGEF